MSLLTDDLTVMAIRMARSEKSHLATALEAARIALESLPCRCQWVRMRAPWEGKCDRCHRLQDLGKA